MNEWIYSWIAGLGEPKLPQGVLLRPCGMNCALNLKLIGLSMHPDRAVCMSFVMVRDC